MYCPNAETGKTKTAKKNNNADRRIGWLLLRKMPKNPQTPLLSFEDLRPYFKLLGKNWWLMLGLATVGYGIGASSHTGSSTFIPPPQKFLSTKSPGLGLMR